MELPRMTEVTTTDIPLDDRTRVRLRIQLTAFTALRLIAPLTVGLSTASVADALMSDNGSAALRLVFLVLVGILAAGAYVEALSTWEEEVEERLTGQLHGGRKWTCTACGTSIQADWWTHATARQAHALLSNPIAHGCPRGRELDA
ncbi:hypothetical protein ACFVGY_30630 [Streptomyces sp. NPDC127106]|uniref:hypothetical protein n=1 Tax=Streptomyces sp. NPDC127106 TaxID=3345360 RepID=UPI003637B442